MGDRGPNEGPTSPTAGRIYRELIEQQLAEEATRKASFEQRGITVITTSGVLVSLLFGIGAVVTNTQHFSPSVLARTLLAGAGAAFALAAVAGIVVNLPLKYADLDPKKFTRLLSPEFWEGPAAPAARRAAEARLGILDKARDRNRWKGLALIAAIILQVAAILLVAGAVVQVLTGWWGPPG